MGGSGGRESSGEPLKGLALSQEGFPALKAGARVSALSGLCCGPGTTLDASRHHLIFFLQGRQPILQMGK